MPVAQPLGMLVAGFDYSTIAADEFHDWYDTEHIPERMRVKGFLGAQRWLGADDPFTAIAIYDLAHVSVLQDPVYVADKGPKRTPWSVRIGRKTKLTSRFAGEQIVPGDAQSSEDAEGLLLFAMSVAPGAQAEVDEWYDKEHLPGLAAVPGCIRARRFRVTEGPYSSLALYHLRGPEVAESQAWKDARDTPWTHKLKSSFVDPLRLLLRRYRRPA